MVRKIQEHFFWIFSFFTGPRTPPKPFTVVKVVQSYSASRLLCLCHHIESVAVVMLQFSAFKKVQRVFDLTLFIWLKEKWCDCIMSGCIIYTCIIFLFDFTSLSNCRNCDVYVIQVCGDFPSLCCFNLCLSFPFHFSFPLPEISTVLLPCTTTGRPSKCSNW